MTRRRYSKITAHPNTEAERDRIDNAARAADERWEQARAAAGRMGLEDARKVAKAWGSVLSAKSVGPWQGVTTPEDGGGRSPRAPRLGDRPAGHGPTDTFNLSDRALWWLFHAAALALIFLAMWLRSLWGMPQ